MCRGGCGHKPAMWIDGGTHAREWISPAVVTWMMKEVVEKDCRHPHLTDKLDWYFLPVLNPDGYEYSRKPGNRMWRKTRSCYEKSCNDTCRGVDPNRNWNYQWNQGGSSEDPCDLTFMGYRPFSEVENQNVRTFILRQKYKIKFFNSLHSYMQAVILPWCYTNDFRPRDFFKMKIMAERVRTNFFCKINSTLITQINMPNYFLLQGVAALKAVHGYQYSVGNCQSLLGYTVSGVSADWALAVGKIPYSFGMELRPDNFTPGFKLPASEIIPTGQETWAFHEVAAQMIIFEFVP